MALLPTDQRSQIMLLIAIFALFLGYVAWDGLGLWPYAHSVQREKINTERREIDSLQAIVDRAKADLASGTVDDLRRKVAEYQANLVLMRQLVPEQNEVATLLENISTRAKVRGVTLGKFQPLAVEPGQPFDTYKYRFEVYGHFDQIGEFLTDIASLKRIMVPQDVTMREATQPTQRLLSDTLGGLLEVGMIVRTYVKSAGPPPGARPAGPRPAPGRPSAND